jgi:hypothetical protein
MWDKSFMPSWNALAIPFDGNIEELSGEEFTAQRFLTSFFANATHESVSI